MLENILGDFNYLLKSEHEKNVDAHQRVIDCHFGELIDWNIQTSMYQMIYGLIERMDKKYLKEMSTLLTTFGNIDDISIQLQDAIIDVLKDKNLISKTFNINSEVIEQTEKNIKVFDIKEKIIEINTTENLNQFMLNEDLIDFLITKFNIDKKLDSKEIFEIKEISSFVDKKLYFVKYI